MKSGAMKNLLRVISPIVFVAFAASASADVWTAIEPYDSVYPYFDGSPNGWGYPSEIWGLTVSDNGNYADGKFSFEIQTNFGDLAARTAFDNAHPSWRWIDSYTTTSPYLQLRNFAAGDLYIRVRSTIGQPDKVYGLVLEARKGSAVTTDPDPWRASLAKAGYTSYAAKEQGTLWLDNDNSFATGTYEDYALHFEEIPEMSQAQVLPGLMNVASVSDDKEFRNSYPTLLLDGSAVNTSGNSATWTATTGNPYAGIWTGQFELPSFNAQNEYIEVWWAMECGNDGVSVTAVRSGAEVPAPSSLILLCIGLAPVALARIRKPRG